MRCLESPWETVAQLPSVQVAHVHPLRVCDPSLRFFVGTLDQLGCVDSYGQEGDPAGFSMLFAGSERIARDLYQVGGFTVQIREHGFWELNLAAEDSANKRREPWTERHRRQALCRVSQEWVNYFGNQDRFYLTSPRDPHYPRLRMPNPFRVEQWLAAWPTAADLVFGAP